MGEHKTNGNAASNRPKCATCAHFFLETPNGGGHCRRYPPQAMMVPQQNAMRQPVLALNSSYPPTLGDRWCGEHPDYLRWMMRGDHTAGAFQDASSRQ